MKYGEIPAIVLFIILILSTCSKKDGSSSNEDNIMKPVKIYVYVKDNQGEPFTEGQVKITAKIGEIRYFGSWMEIEDEQIKVLSNQGIAEFSYSTDDIDPSVGGIRVIKIEILNMDFNVIYEDDGQIFIESGKTEKINVAIS